MEKGEDENDSPRRRAELRSGLQSRQEVLGPIGEPPRATSGARVCVHTLLPRGCGQWTGLYSHQWFSLLSGPLCPSRCPFHDTLASPSSPKHWSSPLGFSLAREGSRFLTHTQPRLLPQDFVSGPICLRHLKWDLHPTPDSLICFPSASKPVPSCELQRWWREPALQRPGSIVVLPKTPQSPSS